jgi:hypothetical protein
MSEAQTPDTPEDPEVQDNLTFLAYVEGLGRKSIDPLSTEGLEIQAKYVLSLPQHPMDVLRRIMVNPFCSPNERISAAKTVMEYSMRKVPSNVELTGKNGAPIKLDTSDLAKLSIEELSQMEALLAKLNPTPTE